MPGPISEFRPSVPMRSETPAKAAGLSNSLPPGVAIGFDNTAAFGSTRSGRGLKSVPLPAIAALVLSTTVYGKPDRKAARPATLQFRNKTPHLDSWKAEGRFQYEKRTRLWR